MPAYNFQGRFVELIKSGSKRHTIRPKRKRPTRLGDKLYLYTGMRTKNCRKIIETVCTRLEQVYIGTDFIQVGKIRLSSRQEIEKLAIADGFNSASEFYEFFEKTYYLDTDNPLCDMELVGW